MPRKGLNISKCYKGKYEYWRGRYEKGIDRNGRMTYGEIYAKTYEEVEKTAESLQAAATRKKNLEVAKINSFLRWLHPGN